MDKVDDFINVEYTLKALKALKKIELEQEERRSNRLGSGKALEGAKKGPRGEHILKRVGQQAHAH